LVSLLGDMRRGWVSRVGIVLNPDKGLSRLFFPNARPLLTSPPSTEKTCVFPPRFRASFFPSPGPAADVLFFAKTMVKSHFYLFFFLYFTALRPPEISPFQRGNFQLDLGPLLQKLKLTALPPSLTNSRLGDFRGKRPIPCPSWGADQLRDERTFP